MPISRAAAVPPRSMPGATTFGGHPGAPSAARRPFHEYYVAVVVLIVKGVAADRDVILAPYGPRGVPGTRGAGTA
jgi:hypothetical protein